MAPLYYDAFGLLDCSQTTFFFSQFAPSIGKFCQHGRCLRNEDGLGYIASLNLHLSSFSIFLGL